MSFNTEEMPIKKENTNITIMPMKFTLGVLYTALMEIPRQCYVVDLGALRSWLKDGRGNFLVDKLFPPPFFLYEFTH